MSAEADYAMRELWPFSAVALIDRVEFKSLNDC